MDNHQSLSKLISDQLGKSRPVVLVSIISREGSTPRTSGTKMVVLAEGRSYGTVGGSALEANVIEEALRCHILQRPALLEFDLTSHDTASQDMICGGKIKILLDFIPSSITNVQLFQITHNAFCNGNKCFFFTSFVEGDRVQVLGRAVMLSDGIISGDPIVEDNDLPVLREELPRCAVTTVISLGNHQLLIDPISRVKTLYCFGAGHVAVPTAHIAALVGFRVIVIDDRAEFANRQRFPEAHDIIVIADFHRAFEKIKVDPDSFLVIVTRGHQYDRIVLEQAIKTEAGYIGMISSRAKRNAIYSTLTAEGIASPGDLERVHSPIGLPIGGETPEEIAVSIVAELIEIRKKQRQ